MSMLTNPATKAISTHFRQLRLQVTHALDKERAA